MEIYKEFRLGPIRIYVTTRRMKRRSTSEERWRNARKFRLRAQAMLLVRQKCRCAMCGRELGMAGDGELHHIIPAREHPELQMCMDNLQLLCHDCHVHVHRNDRGPDGEAVAM